MEHHCPPVKRRRVLHEHQTEHLESNKDSNGSTNVCPNDGNESVIEGSHIEHCDQESSEGKNEIIMVDSELVMSAESNKESNESTIVCPNDGNQRLLEGPHIDHCDPEKEIIEGKNEIIMEDPEIVMSTESKMDAIDSLTNLDETKQNGSQVQIEDNLSTKMSESCGENGHSHSRKKLLVLDVNGLLVDIVLYPNESYKADSFIGPKAVFKRPYCDEFLKFCFEKFDVGIWTSRTRRNIERVLEFLMKDTQQQLLFCWDQSHCTETGFNTIDNSDKPLVLKELKKLWEKEDPNLPWDKGVYDKSNTLLLDDSPYKALCNPPYTAIFPYTYTYRNTKDKGLGPNGDLRKYLEKLSASDNVQTFIKQNPFGQPPITYNNKSWKFYHKIIAAFLPKPELSRRKLIVIDPSGLLVDFASLTRDRDRAEGYKAEGFRADTIQGSRAVFKRPYCDEFLKFCFERFNVGVWSSTTRFNTERVLDFLMGDTQNNLLFCWDHTRCTDTGFNTVENSNKPLVLKELRRLWEKQDPDLPWEIGEYDESNTLLLENTPYKALLNPPHTAIFPYPYRYWKTEDNSLGPNGELRVYLERLAASENVQKFVEENPLGQRPIREKNLSWGFYQKIIRAFSCEPEANTKNSLVDTQCKTFSEPKTISTTSLVTTPTLLETDSTTDSVTPISFEPKTDISDITTASVTPNLSESKNVFTIASITPPNLLEHSTTTSDTPILLEPKTDINIASVTPTLLEPKIDTTTTSPDSPILLEPKRDITTSVTPDLLETKTDTNTSAVDETFVESVAYTTNSVSPTRLETETNTANVSVAPVLLEPKFDVTDVLADPTLVKPNIDTTTSVAPTTDNTIASGVQTLSEVKSDNNSSKYMPP